MRGVNVLVGVTLMAVCAGQAVFAGQGVYPLDSDVVVESAVREVKSIPRDTVEAVAEAVTFVADESVKASNAAKSFFKTDLRDEAVDQAMNEVAEAWDDADKVQFRTYEVNDQMNAKLTAMAGDSEGASLDVREFFANVEFADGTSALYRPALKCLFVQQTMENLLDMEYMLADHGGLKQDLMGHQVEIEVKFVEVSQTTLDELGFNWTFGSKHGGDASIFENLVLPAGQNILTDGLRTGAAALNAGVDPSSLVVAKTAGALRWGLVVNALEQANDTDVLSAPRIVTLDGETATIEVGEERMVPKSFSANSQNTSVYVEHSDWDTELMGVTLEVTPEIASDDLIDLKLNPKVVDLLGYDNYQLTPSDARMWPIQGQAYQNVMNWGRYPIATKTVDGVKTAVGDLYDALFDGAIYTFNGNSNYTFDDETTYDSPSDQANSFYNTQPAYYDQRRMWADDELIAVPSLEGKLPYFRVREMQTQVTVEDGSTVAMGGLIYDKKETYRDKVPVLGSIPLVGRLFRSEGERSIKRNLMIFVTATQVDVNGRRASELALKK